MFISPIILQIAITCKCLTLCKTDIIELSQNCLIKTKKTFLTSKLTKNVLILTEYSKFNDECALLPHSLLEEVTIRASDELAYIKEKVEGFKMQLQETKTTAISTIST